MSESKAIKPILETDAPPPPAPRGEEDAFDLFKRLHRLLRGRYPIALSLATIGAIAGAVVGWVMTVPKYTSVGTIRVKTNQRFAVYQLDKDSPIQAYSYAKSQANLVQDPRVIDQAIRSDDWKRLGRGSDPDAVDDFRASLQVITRPEDPEWIYVRFTDVDARAARLAVTAVVEAYVATHGKAEMIVTPELLSDLQTKITSKEADIQGDRSRIQDILQEIKTTDIEGAYRTLLTRFQEVEKEFMDLDGRLDRAKQAEADLQAGVEVAPPPEFDPERTAAEIARVDDAMRAMLGVRMNARAHLDALREQGLGPKHRSVQRVEAEVATAQKQINEYVPKFLDQHPGFGSGGSDGSMAPLDAAAMAALTKRVEKLRAERDELKTSTFALDKQRQKIAELSDRIKKSQLQLTDIERSYTMLSTETNSDAIKRIQIISKGDEPNKPSIDNRRKLASFGFLLGAGLPIGACVLWGLLDRRYRYSDDATSGRLHPTLLGILPYLPDNMTDPEQAAIAAHCVHQIRTMLQITAAHQDRRVFAITSPTSGDGKTSLTLSLALSFASSGCNTCMIDCDMIGGGLTSSMDAKTDLGLFDALDRGELNGHVRPTSFKRLSLVPVGRNDAHEISRLSPELVGRIIRLAKEQFDVVIIDTGPILGSIEAPLVCSAADGVILAIGHGQARQQADRAMESLASVGATLLGVVFNRAQPGDFRRAVSSASVRSVPNQGDNRPVRALPAIGPMARTVASQSNIRPDEAGSDEH